MLVLGRVTWNLQIRAPAKRAIPAFPNVNSWDGFGTLFREYKWGISPSNRESWTIIYIYIKSPLWDSSSSLIKAKQWEFVAGQSFCFRWYQQFFGDASSCICIHLRKMLGTHRKNCIFLRGRGFSCVLCYIAILKKIDFRSVSVTRHRWSSKRGRCHAKALRSS